jgi:hypothetical protein
VDVAQDLDITGSIGVSWWEMVPVSDGRGKDGDGR